MDTGEDKLDNAYFDRDVVAVAEELVGNTLWTCVEGKITAGKIVETEAYSYKEAACHAHLNRKTKRTQVLFEKPGTAYVYLCYGIHSLFNIVANREGIAEAVLIRAVEPFEGVEVMEKRRMLSGKALTSGPGKLTQALGINLKHNNTLLGDKIWITSAHCASVIEASPRIGVAYAGKDALLPWRFYEKDNKWVSKGINTYVTD